MVLCFSAEYNKLNNFYPFPRLQFMHNFFLHFLRFTLKYLYLNSPIINDDVGKNNNYLMNTAFNS